MNQRDWVTEELATLDLGDDRLNRRAEVLLSLLGDKPGASIPAACNGWAETKAAYRVFAKEDATTDAVLDSDFQATRDRIADAENENPERHQSFRLRWRRNG